MVKTFGFIGLTLALGIGVVEAGEKDLLLDRRVGVWEWDGWMDMGGQKLEVASVETNEWILGGKFLLSRTRQTAKEGGMTFEWLIIAQAGPEDGQYRNWFFDQMGLTSTSTGKVVDGNIHWTSRSESMGEGLHVFSIAEDGTAHLKMTWKPPGKDEWQTFMDMTGRKIEKAPEAPGKPGPMVAPDAYLDRLTGKWEWDGEARHEEEWKPYRSTDEYSWILGGHFLLGRSHIPEMKFEGLSIWQKDPSGGCHLWWYDGMGVFEKSLGTVEGDTLSMEGTSQLGKTRWTLVLSEDGTGSMEGACKFGDAQEFTPNMKAVGKKAE